MREEQEGAGWVVDQYVFVTRFRLNPVYEVKWMAECRGTRGRGLVVQGTAKVWQLTGTKGKTPVL